MDVRRCVKLGLLKKELSCLDEVMKQPFFGNTSIPLHGANPLFLIPFLEHNDLSFQSFTWVWILVRKEKGQFLILDIRLTWTKMGRKIQELLIFQFGFIYSLPWDLREWA
jgi:hypothetical protein